MKHFLFVLFLFSLLSLSWAEDKESSKSDSSKEESTMVSSKLTVFPDKYIRSKKGDKVTLYSRKCGGNKEELSIDELPKKVQERLNTKWRMKKLRSKLQGKKASKVLDLLGPPDSIHTGSNTYGDYETWHYNGMTIESRRSERLLTDLNIHIEARGTSRTLRVDWMSAYYND